MAKAKMAKATAVETKALSEGVLAVVTKDLEDVIAYLELWHSLIWLLLLACRSGGVNLRAGVTSGNRWPALRRFRVASSLLESSEFECGVNLAARGLSFRPSSSGERGCLLVWWDSSSQCTRCSPSRWTR